MGRPLLAAIIVLGLSGPAPAGPTHTPLQGTYGEPFDDGTVQGIGWNATGSAGLGQGLGNLYDNILTINGGAATFGFCNPWGECPTQAFVDWVAPTAQWGDDLFGIGVTGDVVVTRLYYGYSNTIATTTHVIKLYDMVPPSVVPGVTSMIEKAALRASIVVPGNPTGEFLVTVTGLNVYVPLSLYGAAWIKFEETGPGFPGTRWLTGGTGYGIGTSNPGVLYTNKDAKPYPYDLWLPFPSFYFTTVGYVASNIQVALGGFAVPAPAAIGLLAIGGLVALRRRRPVR